MSTMTPEQALTRARALFRMLPRAGLTETTFRELGRAVNLGLPWERLSKDLKLAILQLIRDYSGQLTLIEVEEDVTLAAEAAEEADELETPPDVQTTEPVADDLDMADYNDDDEAEPAPAQVTTTVETPAIEAASEAPTEAAPEAAPEAPAPVRRKQKDKKPAAETNTTETEESPTPPAA